MLFYCGRHSVPLVRAPAFISRDPGSNLGWGTVANEYPIDLLSGYATINYAPHIGLMFILSLMCRLATIIDLNRLRIRTRQTRDKSQTRNSSTQESLLTSGDVRRLNYRWNPGIRKFNLAISFEA